MARVRPGVVEDGAPRADDAGPPGGTSMRIIQAIVGDPRRGDAPDRLEAEVVLTFQLLPGAPVETRTLRSSTPLADPKGRDVRTRLVADAVRLARAGPVPVAA